MAEQGDQKGLTIKDWSEEDRPREKLLTKGKESLSDAELLAIILGSGLPGLSAVDVAKKLLNSHGNDLDLLGRLTIKQISSTKGIGQARAISIAAALELGRRRKFGEKPTRKKVFQSKDVWDYLYPFMADLDHEVFYVLRLNRANMIIGHKKISEGGVSGTVVDSKMVFKHVFQEVDVSSSIILAHNHPSGNTQPSPNDLELTKKIKDAGQLFDINVLDHIIFTNDSFYSFADEGKM